MGSRNTDWLTRPSGTHQEGSKVSFKGQPPFNAVAALMQTLSQHIQQNVGFATIKECGGFCPAPRHLGSSTTASAPTCRAPSFTIWAAKPECFQSL